jgi:mannosylglycerate hydrolase
MKVHFITHTHWDREWYRTFEEFRIYLVYLMDDLLDYLEETPSYHSFMLDGQTVQLEDYLEVRPENFERLSEQIQAGRLIIGPMYIQPDEYIPSGESLIRNFLIAKHVADRLGPMMQIGYFPDAFGQASQIPQLLRGFGIDTAVLWRGVSNEDTTKTEFWWESRDGSRVLTLWMPFSYGNVHSMPRDPDQAVDFIHSAVEKLAAMATADEILLMKGWDHSYFSPETPEMVQILNQRLGDDVQLVHSSLEEIVRAIKKREPELNILRGELRKPQTMRIHAGIGSTRIDIKQANRRTETLLEKQLEPLFSITWLKGHSYPTALINQAWKLVLQSQAHDSICCCCTDVALQTVKRRFDNAQEIAAALYQQASTALGNCVRTDGQEGRPFVVHNPYPTSRNEVVALTVLTPFENLVIVDSAGATVPSQPVSSTKVNLGFDPSTGFYAGATQKSSDDLLTAVGQRPDDPAIYYDQSSYVPLADKAQGIPMVQTTIRFPVGGFPAAGYKTYFLQEGEADTAVLTDLKGSQRSMENQYLKVTLQPDGSLDLLDKNTGYTYEKLHIFENSGDAGDSYNYAPPENDKIITSEGIQATIEQNLDGPFVASFTVSFSLPIPFGLSENGLRRSNQLTDFVITCEISLSAGARWVEVHTTVENTADDHRLRALFPVGFKTLYSYAEEQFGVIQRPNDLPEAEYWDQNGWVEEPLPIYPQQSFVDLNDGQRGLALLNRNLTEYEIIGADESVIALTLFRGVGAMGRPNLVIRPGRASGLEVPTPDALCHGRLEFEYAILPHSGDYSEVAHLGALYKAPMQAMQTDRHAGSEEPDRSFFSVQPPGMTVTCIKKAEWDDGIILRMYNSTSLVIEDGKLWVAPEFANVIVVNLHEKVESHDQLSHKDNWWELPSLKPAQILTLMLIPA